MQHILNFVQLTNNIGTSGQPRAEQFADIAEAGYRTVVNLAMPDSDNAVADEGSLVTRQGMTYVHIPVRWDNPTVSDLRKFMNTMRALDGEHVWVHCAMNLRVSAFMYHYLSIDKGLPDSAARSPILQKWAPRMDEVWKSFLALTPEQVQG